MNIDDLDLDYRLLRLFLTIYDQGSVTAAAVLLGVGQPTVSHGLERLRHVVGDPLFVRAGRGITPTAHAHDMAPRIRHMLEDMRSLTRIDQFDPNNPQHSLHCTIGANDYEAAVVLSALFACVQSLAADITFKIRPVRRKQDMVDKLRDGKLDLAITLDYGGNASDIMQRSLFDENVQCYFDPRFHPNPPDTLDRYCAASHARIVFDDDDEASAIDAALAKRGRSRRTVLQVATFDNLPRLISGTPVIATLPIRLADSVMAGYAVCRCPVVLPSYRFCQSWHVRNAASRSHQWLRDEIFRIARVIDVKKSGL
ncbi:LysR family transcriptional regulator [Thalassospira mesophila]|uniref:LysR family transcriptional regulator n=1 Tax=Thalassospira mesophila TaxID=1293891 RepID=A0A1Y2KYG2_9PROT|nr:LysR family transcriptional regulator [Thalassospira mesophila]OSQ36582.1 LysR family transcriptional regulator [Thalassospira mesophila]